MNTFAEIESAKLEDSQEVGARHVRFEHDMLIIELSDGRQISLPFRKITWLKWLADATPKQRANWSIEPQGYAIWWEDLDDGLEVNHALSLKPLPCHTPQNDLAIEFA